MTDDLKRDEIGQIYKEEVIDPVYDQCFAGAEFEHVTVEFLLENAPENKPGILEVVSKTDNEKLDENIIKSLIHSSNYLSTNEKITVCIFPNAYQDIPLMITVGAGKILVLYNHEHSEELIKVTIAHEYHHSVWIERYFQEGNSPTVLDTLILEGKAVMFEKVVYPDNNGTIINSSYIRTFWEMIESDLNKTDSNRAMEILIGDGKLPYLYGYSEGYKMVKSYLDKNPNLTPEDWLGIEPQVIFEEGEHLSNY